MDKTTQQHYTTLELHKVLAMLAAEAALGDTKEQALVLEPATDMARVSALLAQTDGAFMLSARFGTPSFGSVKNVANPLARAGSGACLSMGELLDIGELLRVVRGVKEWRANCQGVAVSALDLFFEELYPNRYFEDKIFTSIRSEEEMLDTASPELANIRRKIRSAELNVRDRLEKITRSQNYAKYLQDAIITQRGGRFVVPVKVEYRSEMPGLVHDTSASGATLFVEPMAVVEVNNELRVLRLKEQEEIERILQALSSEAAGFAGAMGTSYRALVNLDLIFAKANLAYKMQAVVPVLNDRGIIDLKNARHPLLDKKKVVPTNVALGKDYTTLVVTGPNTGGKTVCLKTLGLLTLMAMCGLMIPAGEGSQICVFQSVLADIGDEQSIEQSLSTFSSHMTNIIGILRVADAHSLVLIDELGAGTDPVEGAALATAILMQFMQKGARVAATTHYAELKNFAIETPGVCNASLEFDVRSLAPTYRLIIGLPGRSNAFAISKRLGLSEEIVARAEGLVPEENRHFEQVVALLEQERRAAKEERQAADAIRAELEQMRKKEKNRHQELKEKQDKILQDARDRAQQLVYKVRLESEAMLSELEQLRRQAGKANAQQQLERARQLAKGGLRSLDKLSDPVDQRVDRAYKLPRPVAVGDNVEIISLDKKAQVLEPADKTGQVLVLAGIIKTRVPETDLRLLENTAPGKPARPATRTVRSGAQQAAQRSAATEIDLRGMAADEALLELDRFIDNAILSGMGSVWIIHGKGTGVLRKAVHSFLRGHKSVKGFRLGVFGEGEDGVTIAELK